MLLDPRFLADLNPSISQAIQTFRGVPCADGYCRQRRRARAGHTSNSRQEISRLSQTWPRRDEMGHFLSLPPSNTAVRLILCRHGETDANVRGHLQGSGIDPPLNDHGALQAAQLGSHLSKQAPQVDLIVASKLLRAQQTADAIAGEYHPNAIRESYAELNEIHWGGHEGKPIPDMRSVIAAWRSGDFECNLPGAESPNAMRKRSVGKLLDIVTDALARAEQEQRIITAVIVGHGLMFRILLAHILHGSLRLMDTITVDNCSVTVLDLVPLESDAPERVADLDDTQFQQFAKAHSTGQIQKVGPIDPHFRALDRALVQEHSHARAHSVEKGKIAVVWPGETVGRPGKESLVVATHINSTGHLW
ncbi:hypothetical protein AMAG_19487 [Allomyces macrogynus ATCC 38327]|uniref:Phosphoglycerate mutase n=1 Tax=Allomyces macrogynus (strain ATCC 38327) TaxID=578462 RepID=A0A0L0SSR9_ALLM3|nr:hypothetical protein AMAG_19487 [Allomyces macrogynus ATCC 38327]|eukprot:KNE65541.1 hypothetical protein AMAG_19487 [Allomyces macrogynus ATCC 38327]